MPLPTLIVPHPGTLASRPSLLVIAPVPVNIFPNKLAPKGPHEIHRNPSFCSFASFLVVSLISFINDQIHEKI